MIKGESFTKQIKCKNIRFDNATDIILICYFRHNRNKQIVFTKTAPNANYPKAYPLKKSTIKGYDLEVKMLPEMTLDLPVGEYDCELKQIIAPQEIILKAKGFFMNLKETVTN